MIQYLHMLWSDHHNEYSLQLQFFCEFLGFILLATFKYAIQYYLEKVKVWRQKY